MQDMLVGLAREAQATVFFVTHSIEEAVYVGDRTFIISSAPGTILHDMPVPGPDFPARVMQQKPEFMKIVFHIRDIMESPEVTLSNKLCPSGLSVAVDVKIGTNLGKEAMQRWEQINRSGKLSRDTAMCAGRKRIG